jgi:hypothetical protein
MTKILRRSLKTKTPKQNKSTSSKSGTQTPYEPEALVIVNPEGREFKISAKTHPAQKRGSRGFKIPGGGPITVKQPICWKCVCPIWRRPASEVVWCSNSCGKSTEPVY